MGKTFDGDMQETLQFEKKYIIESKSLYFLPFTLLNFLTEIFVLRISSIAVMYL